MKPESLNLPALAAIFIICTGLLTLIRLLAPVPVLLADRFLPGAGWLQTVIFGFYAAWVGNLLLAKSRSAIKVRSRIWAFFSLIFFGQLVLGLGGVQSFLMTGDLHIPVPALIAAGPVYRGGQELFMPILFLLSLILLGPAWCSYLCYIGAWDDQLSRLSRTKSGQIPLWATHSLRALILFLVLALAFGMERVGIQARAAALLAIGFGLAGVGMMLAFSRKTGSMVHCTVFCPLGLLSNLLGRLNPFRIRITFGCNNCGACLRVCRYSALSWERISRGKPGLTCSLCGDCVQACPESVLEYRFLSIAPEKARTLFIVLASSLHAIFLATARV